MGRGLGTHRGSYDSARGVLRTYEVEGDDGMVIWHSWDDDGYDDDPDDDDGYDDLDVS